MAAMGAYPVTLQPEEPLVLGVLLIFDPEVAYGGGANGKPFESRSVCDALLGECGMCDGAFDDPFPVLFRKLIRMRAWDRRFIHKTRENSLNEEAEKM
jgi:hypothetical protein